MRVKTITIEFEDTEEQHATKVTFEEGKWTADGPMYSRYHGLLHDIWKLIRTEMQSK